MSSSKWEQGRAYVEQLRGEGRTDEEIRQVMLESGWEEEQLDDLFAVGAPSPSAEPPPAPRESAAPTKRPVPASGPKPRSSTERTFCGVASVVCGLGTVVLLTIGILIFILALMGVLPGEVAYLGLLLGGLLPILIAFVLVLGAGLGVFAFVRGDKMWGGAGAGMCLALLAAAATLARGETPSKQGCEKP